MAPLGILIKFLVPVIGFYYFQKWMRNVLNPPQNYSGDPESKFTANGKKSQEEVIEICPECGNVMMKNHRCQFHS